MDFLLGLTLGMAIGAFYFERRTKGIRRALQALVAQNESLWSAQARTNAIWANQSGRQRRALVQEQRSHQLTRIAVTEHRVENLTLQKENAVMRRREIALTRRTQELETICRNSGPIVWPTQRLREARAS